MDLDALIRQLDGCEARYQEWVAPINQTFHELFRTHPGGIGMADMDREIEAVREAQRAKRD